VDTEQPTSEGEQTTTLQADEPSSMTKMETDTDTSSSAAIGASNTDSSESTTPSTDQDSSVSVTETDSTQGAISEPDVTATEGDWVTVLINFTQDPMAALGDLPSLFDDPMMLPAIGGGVVLLLLLLWLLLRRRSGKSKEDEEQDDLAFEPIVHLSPSEEREKKIPVRSARDTLSEERTQVEQPRPFRPAANPLERVDLLLAVGNYREAENVARLALADDPDNIVLLAKMLDIHFAAGNAEKFQEDAETLRNHIEDEEHPLWQHSLDMGRQLCPDYPLFGVADADTMVLTTALDDSRMASDEQESNDDAGYNQAAGIESSVLRAHDRSEGFSASSISSDEDEDATIVMSNITAGDDINSEAEPPPTQVDNILDFDNDFNFPDSTDSVLDNELNSTLADESGSDDETIADGFASLDFDFDALNDLKQTNNVQELTPSSNIDNDEDSADFAFDSFLPETAQEQTSRSSEDLESEIQDLDFSFEEISMEKEEPINDLDFGDFDIDSITADGPSSVIIDDDTLIDSSDSVETKLELAAAYLDMDDSDGARSLLEEVMGEGDSGQKKRAKDMLERLST
jgi:pilus assembly protein FimV